MLEPVSLLHLHRATRDTRHIRAVQELINWYWADLLASVTKWRVNSVYKHDKYCNATVDYCRFISSVDLRTFSKIRKNVSISWNKQNMNAQQRRRWAARGQRVVTGVPRLRPRLCHYGFIQIMQLYGERLGSHDALIQIQWVLKVHLKTCNFAWVASHST